MTLPAPVAIAPVDADAVTMASTFASTAVHFVTADAHPSVKPALLTGCLPAAIGKIGGFVDNPGPSKAASTSSGAPHARGEDDSHGKTSSSVSAVGHRVPAPSPPEDSERSEP